MRHVCALCLLGALAVAAVAAEAPARPTPATLGAMLTDLGYEPREAGMTKTKDRWAVDVEIDGVNFDVEASLSADGTMLWLAARLATPVNPADATWLKLLGENGRITPALLSFDPSSRSINLRMAANAQQLTPVKLKAALDLFQGYLRRTAPLVAAK